MDKHDLSLDEVSLDELLRELLGRVHVVLDEQARLRLLLDAVVTMAADLSLDGVLERIVRIASTLVDAQYAALGVVDGSVGDRLRTFIHTGLGEESVLAIGDLPTGHGLLGLIIERPEPLRLHDIAEHPASYGFPPNHPPMHSFLGVPVRTRERIFGNLYLTEKAGGVDFTEQDEEIVVALAAAAGVAIENAHLYEEASRREQWLAATAEITAELAASLPADEALQLVADRSREVAAADLAWIVTDDDRGVPRLRAVAGVDGVDGVDGDLEALAPRALADPLVHQVLDSGRAATRSAAPDQGPPAAVPAGLDWPDPGPVMVVPLRSSSGTEGVLALGWTGEHVDQYHRVDVALPASFAEQAALALEVARAREGSQRLAVLEDRDRIARDLHDLVIQRLFAVCLGLQSTAKRSGDAEVADRLELAVDDLDATIKDIRRSIFALGSMEGGTDIQTEVTRMVERAEAMLKFRPSLRVEGPVRTMVSDRVAPDLLAVLGEALSNASRHARASSVEVELRAADGVLALVVSDDGRGMPDQVPESGLANMRERAGRHGGALVIGTEPGGGTRVEWRVPTA